MVGTIYQLTTSESHKGLRLDKVLAATLCDSLSRSRIKALILEDCVTINHKLVSDPAHKVQPGQTIVASVPEVAEATPQPQNIPLDIVYEDQDIIVINKAAGMVVHPAPGSYDNTLVNALLYHCKNELSGIGGVGRPGIVHRLDKDTSGLMVVAKNDAAHQGLSKQFAERTLSRRYYALVWGIPKPTQGTLEGNIGRHPRHRQKMAVLQHGGKPARTHYKVTQTFKNLASIVECSLESGRTHQIRVHLSTNKHPVIGDIIYGNPPKYVNGAIIDQIKILSSTPTRHFLHAYSLQLIHPITSKKLLFESELPNDMESVIAFIREK